MNELVAVDKDALDRAIRYLRGHASFKRSEADRYSFRHDPYLEAARKIDGYADALEKQYPVRIDLAQSARACEVGQHAYSDMEGLCIFCEEPRPLDAAELRRLEWERTRGITTNEGGPKS